MESKKSLRRLRIKRGIRQKISGTPTRPRMSVFKSNTGLYVQLVDDTTGRTLVSASSRELGSKLNTNVELAKKVGEKVAEKAKNEGISSVVFDRNGYLYHGKVKALADGAREGGLEF